VNYTLDLNAGLTQVLNDGTNQYLYGLGRIAQVNTGTDYFMTDALGSVRQLTDSQGDITLANAYEPYGTLSQTAGSAQTSYGFTGEFTDPSGMVYLRARYYSSGDGRFLTRDTWEGNTNVPVTYNKWAYANANPIMYTDPTGQCSSSYKNRIETAKKNVSPLAGDALTTYVAAGIAVQCWGIPADLGGLTPGYYNGAGIAQISKAQTQTEYGAPVKDPGLIILGIVIRNSAVRGYGLRCYIPIGSSDNSLCNCLTPREINQMTLEQRKVFENTYELEPFHDPVKEPKWAVEYMRRRIKQVLDTCNYGKINCSETDKFIIAALAQNGSGFTIANMDLDIKINYLEGRKIDWKEYFPKQGNVGEFKTQLRLFKDLTNLLHNDGYYLPNEILQDRTKMYLEDLIAGRYNN
jgi:RHS repeat-associated protein